VIAECSASVIPITAAPSIWLRIRSGLTGKPQSMATSIAGTVTVPSPSTFTRAAAAT
jgi:hypothetical protein